MKVNDAKRLRLLADENRKLKKLVADQALDSDGHKGAALKKVRNPKARRSAMHEVVARFGLSFRRFCRITAWNRSTLQYCAKGRDDDALRARRAAPSAA